MGDSIGDLQMSYNLKYKVQLSIGFLNHDQENLLEKYESAFDIVVLKDSSLEWITRLLDALAKPAVA